MCALFQACKVAEDERLKQFGDIATRLMSCTAQRYGRSTEIIERDNDSEVTTNESVRELLSLTSSERTQLQRAMRGETLLILNRGELARFFLVNCRGYLGCGGSGYVVRSCVDGVDFAVKRWNKYEWDIHNAMDVQQDLEYEMQIYAYLHKYHPHVLGRIVRRPIAMCEDLDTKDVYEYVLVLTVVGEHLERIERIGDEGNEGREVCHERRRVKRTRHERNQKKWRRRILRS